MHYAYSPLISTHLMWEYIYSILNLYLGFCSGYVIFKSGFRQKYIYKLMYKFVVLFSLHIASVFYKIVRKFISIQKLHKDPELSFSFSFFVYFFSFCIFFFFCIASISLEYNHRYLFKVKVKVKCPFTETEKPAAGSYRDFVSSAFTKQSRNSVPTF